MEKCEQHETLIVDIAQIKRDIAHIKEKLDDRMYNIDNHIKESVPVRDAVKTNTDFRRSASKALWGAYAAILALFIRILTQK